jgi:hypothetical protein
MTMPMPEEWDLLNERQQELAEDLNEIVLKYDKFDKSPYADGAHYAAAALNPFKAEGLMCSNCIFYDELGNGCQIVTGLIEPEAVCKMWIIPESLLAVVPGQLSRNDLETMTPTEIMAAKAAGRLDSLLGKS